MARRIPVPDRVLERGLLDRVDYGDAFVVDAEPEGLARYGPEQCVELGLGSAPGWVRAVVRVAHRRILGLRLGPADPSVPVPGWQRLRHGPDEVVYGVPGRIVTPRLVLATEPGRLTLVTVLRFEHPAAGVVWAVVGPVHRTVARLLLDRGVRRATQEVRHTAAS